MHRVLFKRFIHDRTGHFAKIFAISMLTMLLDACGVPSPSTLSLPPPTATVEPKIALVDGITEVLGAGDGVNPRLTGIAYSFPEKGDITITWSIRDEGEEALTREGALRDAAAILKVIEVQQTRFVYVILSGTYSKQDENGNLTEIEAVNFGFNKSTLEKVDWQDFQPADIFSLADVSVIHSLFQY